MVNRVDNRSSVAAAYESTARKRKRSETDAPAFLLGDEEGVVWERGDKKEKPKPKKEEKENTEEVIIKQETEEIKGEGFNVSAAFAKIRKSIKEFFDKVLQLFWYGEDEPHKKEAAAEKEMTDEEKEEMKLLHNTSILTCYDKKGKLTKMEGLPSKKTYRQYL